MWRMHSCLRVAEGDPVTRNPWCEMNDSAGFSPSARFMRRFAPRAVRSAYATHIRSFLAAPPRPPKRLTQDPQPGAVRVIDPFEPLGGPDELRDRSRRHVEPGADRCHCHIHLRPREVCECLPFARRCAAALIELRERPIDLEPSRRRRETRGRAVVAPLPITRVAHSSAAHRVEHDVARKLEQV
jgi:hypothetical protein